MSSASQKKRQEAAPFGMLSANRLPETPRERLGLGTGAMCYHTPLHRLYQRSRAR